ncbi:Pumilio homolog 4 [Linum perenne]
MASGSNIDMLPTLDDRLQEANGSLEHRLQTELDLMLRAQRNQRMVDRDRDQNIYRSGSAPPTVEGSLRAVGSLFQNTSFSGANNSFGNGNSNNSMMTEDEIRLHPAYLSYYYSNDNINPRLPPPLLSKEDWRVAQRFQAGGSSFGGIGDLRKKKLVDNGDSSSLFSMQPRISTHDAEKDLMELRNGSRNNFSRQTMGVWPDSNSDGLIGLHGSGIGVRRKSFADILQEGLDQSVSMAGQLSRPASHNALSNPIAVALPNGMESIDSLKTGAAPPGFGGRQSPGTSVSHSFASAVGSSISRSPTPEQKLVGRPPTPGLPPTVNRVIPVDKHMVAGSTLSNGHSSSLNDLGEINAALSGLGLSNSRHTDQDSVLHACQLDRQAGDMILKLSNGQNRNFSHSDSFPLSSNYTNLASKIGVLSSFDSSNMNSNGEVRIPKRTSSSANLHSKVHSSSIGGFESPDIHHQSMNIPSSSLDASTIAQSLNRLGNQIGSDLHSPIIDAHYAQYLRRSPDYSTHTSAGSSGHQFQNYLGTSQGDLNDIQKAYLELMLAQQKQEYDMPLSRKAGTLSQAYYRNPSYGLGVPYHGNSMGNSVHPSVTSINLQNEQVAHFSSMMQNSMAGSVGSWNSDTVGTAERRYGSSLLDEFKNNKNRSFELLDIVGHVVEFSTDQYGSRFIQQKLETATIEEKNKIFPEIIPHARTLMTDVFGNYVIQKFFEHGTEAQRMELASELTSHVLPLSLQMYGCRVIQKALEVVDAGHQIEMVTELDGSIMKCVRDQNGNHVIQKCIECVPEDRIQFIISSFYGQVVVLSTHPYGCRVIQRVLEHCKDENTQQVIMDEIMQSVCTLAQDQYGNYVIQHVLEHGKPHERSAIINKLAGQIVKMSQQKFASNVVEKCLTFGGPEERQILVKEMLGSTDENEPLQAMMKDPFGNYVVQKVLETCDDQSLELILSRIKVHLNALKRYTYGKHIVSRVEKLITTGERRIGLSSSVST